MRVTGPCTELDDLRKETRMQQSMMDLVQYIQKRLLSCTFLVHVWILHIYMYDYCYTLFAFLICTPVHVLLYLQTHALKRSTVVIEAQNHKMMLTLKQCKFTQSGIVSQLQMLTLSAWLHTVVYAVNARQESVFLLQSLHYGYGLISWEYACRYTNCSQSPIQCAHTVEKVGQTKDELRVWLNDIIQYHPKYQL